MFLDNDDMCNPFRMHFFRSAYQDAAIPEGCTFSLPCKLLLDENLPPSEGRLEKFVNMRDLGDFDYWRRDNRLERRVTLATNSRVNDLDAEEYFDYIVPSAILEKFFQLTPVAVGSHKFCDLRLLAILELLAPLETEDNPRCTWLLAHYKVSEQSKRTAFDHHGKRRPGIQSVDQSSFLCEQVTSEDERLSEHFPKISPGQVAMCRGHIESFVIQFCGWNDNVLETIRGQKVTELNSLYGVGFGDALWAECHEHILSLFDPETLVASKGAWKSPETDR